MVSLTEGDLADIKVDAIVNTVKPGLISGSSYIADLDGQVCQKAGPDIGSARRPHGAFRVGDLVVTSGFKLPANFVFHVTGPIYTDGKDGKVEALKGLYVRILAKASQMGLKTIKMPVISSGPYRQWYHFPADLVCRSAGSAVIERILSGPGTLREIGFVVPRRDQRGLLRELSQALSEVDDRAGSLLVSHRA